LVGTNEVTQHPLIDSEVVDRSEELRRKEMQTQISAHLAAVLKARMISAEREREIAQALGACAYLFIKVVPSGKGVNEYWLSFFVCPPHQKVA